MHFHCWVRFKKHKWVHVETRIVKDIYLNREEVIDIYKCSECNAITLKNEM